MAPGASPILQALEINQDIQGFFSLVPQGQLGLTFSDGFESGDVAAWSIHSP